VLYPNISGLPLPGSLYQWYQGVLPTYLYMFQFGVNTAERGATSFSDPKFLGLVVALVLAVVGVAYSAWTWRQALADDAAADADPGENDGTDGKGGNGGPDGGTREDRLADGDLPPRGAGAREDDDRHADRPTEGGVPWVTGAE
jgi:hypothetical protein